MLFVDHVSLKHYALVLHHRWSHTYVNHVGPSITWGLLSSHRTTGTFKDFEHGKYVFIVFSSQNIQIYAIVIKILYFCINHLKTSNTPYSSDTCCIRKTFLQDFLTILKHLLQNYKKIPKEWFPGTGKRFFYVKSSL